MPTKSINFEAAELAFDPAAVRGMVYPPDVNDHTSDQRRPVPEAMRALAAPLTLPGTVIARFHDPARIPRPRWVQAALDPEANRGYTSASFHLYYYEGRRFSVTVRGPGTVHTTSLLTCPKCGSLWCTHAQQAWGNATDCPDCGYHQFYSIGD